MKPEELDELLKWEAAVGGDPETTSDIAAMTLAGSKPPMSVQSSAAEPSQQFTPVGTDYSPQRDIAAQKSPPVIPSDVRAPAETRTPNQVNYDLLKQYFLQNQKSAKDQRDLSLLALEKANEGQFFANLGQAGAQLGHAISRSSAPLDTSFYKNLSEQSQQPLKFLETVGEQDAKRQAALSNFFIHQAGLQQKDEQLKQNEKRLGILEKGLTGREENREVNRIAKIQTEFEASVKDLVVSKRAAQDVKELLKLENPIADSSYVSKMSKLMGEVGALSEGDVRRVGKPPGWLASAANNISLALQNKMSDDVRAALMDITNTLEKLKAQQIEERANELAPKFEARLGIPAAEIKSKYLLPAPLVAPGQQRAKAVPADLQQMAKDELAKRKGAANATGSK